MKTKNVCKLCSEADAWMKLGFIMGILFGSITTLAIVIIVCEFL